MPQQTFDQFFKLVLDEEVQLVKEGYIKKNHAYAAKGKSHFIEMLMEIRFGKENKFKNNDCSNHFSRNDGTKKQVGIKSIICRHCGGENHMKKFC